MDMTRAGVRDMATLVARLGEQLRSSHAVARDHEADVPRDVDRVVVFGMGGSAAAAEVVGGTLAPGRFDLRIVRGYAAPFPLRDRDLLVFSSYSGNTEETLSCFEAALEAEHTPRAVALGSGGRLAELAQAADVPVLPVPAGLPPRASLGHGVGLLCGILERAGLVDELGGQVEEAAARLDEGVRRHGLDGGAPTDESVSTWADRLSGRLPVVYAGAPVTIASMRRLRAQLNENSKMLVSTAELPELDHNEIVGWGHPTAVRSEAVVVALRDPAEHPRVARRFEITREVLADRVADWGEVVVRDGSPLARCLDSIQWGDALSVALAANHGVDPGPVSAIDTLKDRLGRP
jgi:glucose/mannose-6-phosphate isomerase